RRTRLSATIGEKKAIASCLFTFAYFRSSTRRRFPLRFDLIVIDGGADEIFQRTRIDLITLEKIDRSSRVAFEARVEELVRIWEARPVGKGKLHLPFVGVGDRDYSAARPHRASHPLPFLDDLPVGLADALADAGERLPRQSVSSAISRSIRSDGSIGSLCLEVRFREPRNRDTSPQARYW